MTLCPVWRQITVTTPIPHGEHNRTRTAITAVVAVAFVVILIAIALVTREQRRAPTPSVPSASSTPTPSPTNAQSPIEIWATSLDRAFTTTYGTWETADGSRDATDDQPVDVTLRLDSGDTRQTFNGVGASLTHSSAQLLATMPNDARAELLKELFAPDGPVRLGVLRIPFGGSDFVAEPAYTYNDLPDGETDWNLDRFSTAPDDATLRPVLREILAIAPDIQIIASPWSPPAWLKDSGSLVGGRLLDDDRAASTYARYLVRAVEEYTAAGIPISAITVQNEPQARTPDGYPGTDIPVADEVAIISALGPALQNAGLSTQILAYDHNWALHPADDASTLDGADPEYEYPSDVLRSTASPWVDGVAYHCYFGEAERMTGLHNTFPAADLWVTECSGSHGEDDSSATIFADTLGWQAENLVIASLNNWASTVLTWNLALDTDGGPHIGGCDTCTGVVTIEPDNSVTRNAEYYALAGVGRFAARGATVISTATVIATDSVDALPHVAMRNPDGSSVVLVYNESDAERLVDIDVTGSGERVAQAAIPPRALATVVLP
jgi:glucosylceramidase